MATIMVDDSENLEKAIKRFKRMVEKEGIIREYKKREYFEKPSASRKAFFFLERKILFTGISAAGSARRSGR